MSLLNNFFRILYSAAAGTFITVGSFVGITLLLFGYINYKTEGKFIKTIEERKKLQVVIGAFLGLTPGCGGAIMVMPLYLLGKVSFGTVVATLIATMGDAAFVIIVYSPKIFLTVSIISFIVAIITGYLIDFFNIGTNLVGKISSKEELKKLHKVFEDEPTELELDSKKENINFLYKENNNNNNEIGVSFKHKHSIEGNIYRFRHNQGYKIFWGLTILGFILGIMDLMQIDLDNTFPIKNLSFIGVIGTFFSIIYTVISKKIIKDDNIGETESKLESLRETLIHNAGETAFVITWIFMAFLFYEIGLEVIGGEEVLIGFMNKSGFLVVIVAVLIGLIPGCGPQIVLATLFVTGAVPFSALIANAICNDGDALFPLMAINKKSAMWVTLYSLIPAIIVGGLFYLIGY
ncbi:MAG: putative manganese transporter [Fusobacterium sp.]